MTRARDESSVSCRQWVVALAVGALIALTIWRQPFFSGGLIGGDTYPYFFPQKQMLSDAFAHGEIPLWHDRTGLGYPLLAESQAGVFYPTNQILYRLFDVNRAYSLSLVLHYWLAFVATWRFARSQMISPLSALLAAVIFVYGWFPARLSLEWSIIGGVWFPVCLWMADRWTERRTLQRFAALTVCFALHLLAGHFTLAFITQLTCLAYVILKPVLHSAAEQQTSRRRQIIQNVVSVIGAIGVAGLLAAVQIVPTLELRAYSQRDGQQQGQQAAFDPQYGHLPPVYVTQIAASWWYWHSPEIVVQQKFKQPSPLKSPADTNAVEAHLYFGLLPLLLILLRTLTGFQRHCHKSVSHRWLLLGALALVYSFGWFVPWTRVLPGFGFFMGPGRYTIVTAMAGAIIASLSLDELLRRRSSMAAISIVTILCVLTLADLLKSSNTISDAIVVEQPPLDGLNESWIRRKLTQEETAPVRLLMAGQNVGNLFGVSSLPVYLGIGPREYFEEQKQYRSKPADGDNAPFPTAQELRLLQSRGVTHIVLTEPVSNPSAEIKLIGAA
ncbi:MAG: YfhO family protein, partial [Planctomycetaceae bacterium]|nr:YfhO family protein [Planctomycetaceae bacterium]